MFTLRLAAAIASAAVVGLAAAVVLWPRKGERAAKSRYWPVLANEGNSCYLNCALHALAAVFNVIRDAMPKDSRLAEALRILSTPVDTHTVLSASSMLGATVSGRQHDAIEAMECLLETFCDKAVAEQHNDRLVTTSRMHDTTYNLLCLRDMLYNVPYVLFPWQGLCLNAITCLDCVADKKQNDNGSFRTILKTETFSVKVVTSDIFQALCVEETVVNDFACANCARPKLRACLRESAIIVWPQVFFLHMPRCNQSIDASCTPPLAIEPIEEQKLKAVEIYQPRSPVYRLRAAVAHFKNHYSVVRLVKNRRWMLFSDMTCKPVSIDYVKEVCASDAHLLVYAQDTPSECFNAK